MSETPIEGEVIKPKHPGGRPLKYQNVEKMQVIIDQYFIDISRNRDAINANQPLPEDTITDMWHPTVTGLALVLDLDRDALINYQGKPEFHDTIKRAKNKVQGYLEQRLYESSPAGAIFNLKNNYGWRDERHLSVESNELRVVKIITDASSPLAIKLSEAEQGLSLEHNPGE